MIVHEPTTFEIWGGVRSYAGTEAEALTNAT